MSNKRLANDAEKIEIAEAYVNQQFALMERHGCLGTVTPAIYSVIVKEIANLVEFVPEETR